MESSPSMAYSGPEKTPAVFDQNVLRSVSGLSGAGSSGRESLSPGSGVSARVQPTEPSLNMAGTAFPL